jgi:hypothetical protein
MKNLTTAVLAIAMTLSIAFVSGAISSTNPFSASAQASYKPTYETPARKKPHYKPIYKPRYCYKYKKVKRCYWVRVLRCRWVVKKVRVKCGYYRRY